MKKGTQLVVNYHMFHNKFIIYLTKNNLKLKEKPWIPLIKFQQPNFEIIVIQV